MKLRWDRLRVHTAHPFRISRGVKTAVEVVWVRVEANGIEGWGEADPSEYYGETAATVEAALEALRPTVEAAEDPWKLEELEDRLRGALRANPAAHAAVSAALHDWMGKALGQPLWRLWGLDPATAPESSFTLGIDEPEAMAERAAEARGRGFRILKVKVGTGEDEPRLEAVRSAAPDVTLRVDANAAWTPRQALGEIERLTYYGVEFVEQPLPPEDREGCRWLRERAALPIVVDESCLVASDIPGLVGLADGVNIKLAKCGGPREALRMIHVARACGLRVMMGCMLETSLGIAPAAHLSPLLDWADLDGAALLRDDPFEGPRLVGGRIVLDERPGLGIERRSPPG